MDDYISREAALNFEMEIEADPGEIPAISKGMAYYSDYLEKIPAADVVERKTGKWIWDDEGYHCSECFYHAYGNTCEVLCGDWHYCPNCGAEMEP